MSTTQVGPLYTVPDAPEDKARNIGLDLPMPDAPKVNIKVESEVIIYYTIKIVPLLHFVRDPKTLRIHLNKVRLYIT